MCAGSLAHGCWILAVFWNQFSGLWCPWVSFGMLADSTLASWRTLGRFWDDPGTLEGTGKDPLRSRLGFYRFFINFWDPFWEFCGYFWTKKKQFFISISRLLFLLVLGCTFGCLGLEKHVFGNGSITKINFCRNWMSHDSRVNFSWFRVACGPIFMAFVDLETCSKINEFWCESGVIPDLEHRVGLGRCVVFWGTVNSPPGPETWDMRHEKWEIDLLENPKCENTKKSRL